MFFAVKEAAVVRISEGVMIIQIEWCQELQNIVVCGSFGLSHLENAHLPGGESGFSM